MKKSFCFVCKTKKLKTHSLQFSIFTLDLYFCSFSCMEKFEKELEKNELDEKNFGVFNASSPKHEIDWFLHYARQTPSDWLKKLTN